MLPAVTLGGPKAPRRTVRPRIVCITPVRGRLVSGMKTPGGRFGGGLEVRYEVAFRPGTRVKN
jgi:hypothetical protein